MPHLNPLPLPLWAQAVAEDCTDQAFNARLPPLRRSEVLQGLVASLPTALPAFLGVLQQAAGAAAGGGSMGAAATRVTSACLHLLASLAHFIPPAAVREAGAARVAAAVWDGRGLARVSEPVQAAALALVCALARRRYDVGSGAAAVDVGDLQDAGLGAALRVAIASVGAAWPTQRPLPPDLAALAGPLGLPAAPGDPTPLASIASLRSIASAVAAAGLIQVPVVCARATGPATPPAAAATAALMTIGFFTVSAVLLRHASTRVRASAAEGLSDALQACPRSQLSALPGFVTRCLPALCSAMVLSLEREGRFVLAGVVAKARAAHARDVAAAAIAAASASVVAAAPASQPPPPSPGRFMQLFMPGPLAPDADGTPADVAARADDFDDAEEEEWAAVASEVRGRVVVCLAAVTAIGPAVAAATLRDAYAFAARLVEAPPDAKTAFGTATAASRAARWLDACNAAAEVVMRALPPLPRGDSSPPGASESAAATLTAVREAAQLLLSAPLASTSDPCLRSRTLGALAAFAPLWAASPPLLGTLLEQLFGAVQFAPPVSLVDAARATDAAAAGGGSVALQQLLGESQFVRQRACGALVSLARTLPRELLPLLGPLMQRIGAVLALPQPGRIGDAVDAGGLAPQVGTRRINGSLRFVLGSHLPPSLAVRRTRPRSLRCSCSSGTRSAAPQRPAAAPASHSTRSSCAT